MDSCYKRRKMVGLCPRCGSKRDIDNKITCSVCIKKESDKRRRLYQKRQINKACVRCGKNPSEKDGTTCKSCRTIRNKRCTEFRKVNVQYKKYQKKYNDSYYQENQQILKDKSKKYRKENPKWVRNTNIKNSYGISLNEYERKLIEQANKCAICRKEHVDEKGKRLHIDHNHKNNKIRGLLCQHCNNGLGCFKDDIVFLKSAILYLRKY